MVVSGAVTIEANTTLKFVGSVDPADTFVVAETVTFYDDGAKENRIWKLIKVNNNYYEGTTDNVIGIAKGITCGNTFHWKYKFQLSLYGRKTKVSFDDYMYLQDSNVIINKAKMKKFGITLGTVFLFFKKNA